MMKHITYIFLVLFLYSCGKAHKPEEVSTWNGVAEPLISDASVKKLKKLPLKGKAKGRKLFWSGDYWALKKGLINYRWYNQEYGFNLHSPTQEEAKAMSTEDIMELSPTEKYDLLKGRYNYPLKAEVATKANPNAEYWEGICHGWAPAAINYNEPTPKSFTNPQGIRVPFGSTDIKALISYYYAHVYKAPNTFQTGRRCPNRGGIFNWNPDCKNDLNAGTFHIILANNLGLKGKGFIADIKRFEEVWNHPFRDYKSEITDRRSPGWFARREVNEIVSIRTEVSYLDEAESNTWEPVIGTNIQKFGHKTYEYEVDLDANGNIIGGRWESTERPDFLWTVGRPDSFGGNLAGLQNLLDG
jgi:hypothetical protein